MKGDFLAAITKRPLQLGDPDSSKVRKWRNMLLQKGFVVKPTGAFDQPLLSATMAAQVWSGVTMDGLVGSATWHAFRRKKRSPHPISTFLAWIGRPKIIDARHGRAGFPKHRSRSWSFRSTAGIRAKLGHYTGGQASFVADAHFHVESNYLTAGGAPAIAYTLGVDKDGTLFVFNEIDDLTWHCDGGHNQDTLGIVFRGAEEGPTFAQRRTLKWLWAQLEAGTFKPTATSDAWPKLTTSTTHQHVNSTSCPGVAGENFYRSISGRFITAL